MFAITSSTRTRGHNLGWISKNKTKQRKSNSWAVNQPRLPAKVTAGLLWMWKIYTGSKRDWTNTWRRHLLRVIIQAETNTRKSLSWRLIAGGWERIQGRLIHTYTYPLLPPASTSCPWYPLETKHRARQTPVWPCLCSCHQVYSQCWALQSFPETGLLL